VSRKTKAELLEDIENLQLENDDLWQVKDEGNDRADILQSDNETLRAANAELFEQAGIWETARNEERAALEAENARLWEENATLKDKVFPPHLEVCESLPIGTKDKLADAELYAALLDGTHSEYRIVVQAPLFGGDHERAYLEQFIDDYWVLFPGGEFYNGEGCARAAFEALCAAVGMDKLKGETR
jgi:hypothetical protein